MYIVKELYKFLLGKAEQLTEEWYSSLDKSGSFGVYSSKDSKEIEILKQQNYGFHLLFCQLFKEEHWEDLPEFKAWISQIANDEKHLSTPSYLITKEFFRTRDQYLQLLKEFASLHKNTYSQEAIEQWNKRVVDSIDAIIIWFMKEQHNYSLQRMQCQQELINELSSPVISLSNTTALLPIIGEIDTARAKMLLEKTLLQCSEKRMNHLVIDLSGVVMIDTMVARQIFDLVEALKLIGVKTTLSGIRPEIAQTAVQLGLDFTKLSIVSTLATALAARHIQL